MSDLRDELIEAMENAQGWGLARFADAILEKFEVTPKPEPPVISDEELGFLAMQANPHESFTRGHVGERLREALERLGLEIVRKEVAE